MSEKVKLPVLSVLVPTVKLVLVFLTITETPPIGSPLLFVTTPFTRHDPFYESGPYGSGI